MSTGHSREETDVLNNHKLSVWMVNYNSASLIENALQSLAQEPIDEIVVWDNASSAADVARLKELGALNSRVKLVLSPINIGFGAAMNAIADRFIGDPRDVIWILNPDTELLTGSVRALKEAVLSGGVDIVSPVLVTGHTNDPSIWFIGGGVDVKKGVCWHDEYGGKNFARLGGIRLTNFMTGAAPMMMRRTWAEIGGFHDNLFLYWEDVELSLRATDLGLSMGVHPGCTVWHLEGGSGESDAGHSVAYYFYNARNRIRVCSQRAGVLNLIFGLGMRETVVSVLRPLLRERAGKLNKFKAALLGTFRGIFSDRDLGPRRITGLVPASIGGAGMDAAPAGATEEETPT